MEFWEETKWWLKTNWLSRIRGRIKIFSKNFLGESGFGVFGGKSLYTRVTLAQKSLWKTIWTPEGLSKNHTIWTIWIQWHGCTGNHQRKVYRKCHKCRILTRKANWLQDLVFLLGEFSSKFNMWTNYHGVLCVGWYVVYHMPHNICIICIFLRIWFISYMIFWDAI